MTEVTSQYCLNLKSDQLGTIIMLVKDDIEDNEDDNEDDNDTLEEGGDVTMVMTPGGWQLWTKWCWENCLLQLLDYC